MSFTIGDKITVSLIGGKDRTFVSLGCDGYERMAIKGNVSFDPSIVIAENATGSADSSIQVQAGFETIITSFDEFLVSISLPAFQIRQLPGFSFKVTDATLDLSDVSNAGDFPNTYKSPNMENFSSTLFQGVYVRELQVRFPKDLRSTSNVRPTMTCNQLIIDEYGVSGRFKGKDLLSLDNGRIGNWGFSIDSAAFQLVVSNVVQASFKGSVVVPVLNKSTPLGYRATIQAGGVYNFQVTNLSALSMSMWAATLNLDPNSSLIIAVENEQFYPKAILNGSLSVSLSSGGNLSLADITFQELTIQRREPILACKAFTLASEIASQKMERFPISLKELGLRLPTGTDAGFYSKLRLNLTGNNGNGFA